MESMAAKGLYFQDNFGFIAALAQGEPAKVRYRLEPVQSEVSKPDPELVEIYESMGWEYVTCFGIRYHVFMARNPEAPEPHTDPKLQSIAVGKFFRRAFLGLIPLAILNFVVFSNVDLDFHRDIFFRAFPLYYFMTEKLFGELLVSAMVILADIIWIRNIAILFQLYNWLKLGVVPDRSNPPKKNYLGIPILILMAIFVVNGAVSGGMSCVYDMRTAQQEIPWVHFEDMEQAELKYIRGDTVSKAQKDYLWKSWNLLAPIKFTSLQEAHYSIAEPEVSKGENGVTIVSHPWTDYCRLETEYFHCLTPGLARALYKDLESWYDFSHGTEMDYPGLDGLVVYYDQQEDGDRSGTIFGLKGKNVLYVRYSGHEDIRDYIDDFAAILEPEALKIKGEPKYTTNWIPST